jgi:hypothetical protein
MMPAWRMPPPSGFTITPRLADQIGWAAERGTDGGAEPFREADAHGIEMTGPIGSGDSGCHNRIEQPRTVQMAREAVVGGPAADFDDRIVRLYAASAAVMRVLQANQFRADAVIVRGPDAVHELFDAQHAMVALDGLRGDSEQLSIRALLVAENVTVRLAEELVARLAMDAQAELIAHRAAGNVERGFLAEHRGDARLQTADGRVFSKHVVANVRRGHRGAHRGRRSGDRIAA